jgi:hypothetical protein
VGGGSGITRARTEELAELYQEALAQETRFLRIARPDSEPFIDFYLETIPDRKVCQQITRQVWSSVAARLKEKQA